MPKAPRVSRKSSTQGVGRKMDVFMSIKLEHMNNIASGRKNHKYRKHLLPSSVRYICYYVTSPTSAMQHVAKISGAKNLGEVPEDGALGNADFNQGRKISKYGYEILDLWKLNEVITLHDAVSTGVLKEPPQKHHHVTIGDNDK